MSVISPEGRPFGKCVPSSDLTSAPAFASLGQGARDCDHARRRQCTQSAHQVIWNASNGTDVFFQTEMPYDGPSQAAWREAPGVDGYAAFKVSPDVESFHGPRADRP